MTSSYKASLSLLLLRKTNGKPLRGRPARHFLPDSLFPFSSSRLSCHDIPGFAPFAQGQILRFWDGTWPQTSQNLEQLRPCSSVCLASEEYIFIPKAPVWPVRRLLPLFTSLQNQLSAKSSLLDVQHPKRFPSLQHLCAPVTEAVLVQLYRMASSPKAVHTGIDESSLLCWKTSNLPSAKKKRKG